VKDLILIATFISVIELVGFKGLWHLIQNVIALFLLWKGIELASGLCKKIYYPHESR